LSSFLRFAFRGLISPLAQWENEHIRFDVLIDGEAVGDTLHAFDLLKVKGNCLRKLHC
jgi:hypothetical protein